MVKTRQLQKLFIKIIKLSTHPAFKTTCQRSRKGGK